MNAPVKEFDEITGLTRAIGKGTRVVSLSGLTSTAAKAFVLARLQKRTGKTFVVVTDTNKDLDTFSCDLEFWTDTISRAETAETGKREFRSPIPQSSLFPRSRRKFIPVFRLTPRRRSGGR
jgi:hypothetical protein